MAYEMWKGFYKLPVREQKFLILTSNPKAELSNAVKKEIVRIERKGKRLHAMKSSGRRRRVNKKKNKKRR